MLSTRQASLRCQVVEKHLPGFFRATRLEDREEVPWTAIATVTANGTAGVQIKKQRNKQG